MIPGHYAHCGVIYHLLRLAPWVRIRVSGKFGNWDDQLKTGLGERLTSDFDPMKAYEAQPQVTTPHPPVSESLAPNLKSELQEMIDHCRVYVVVRNHRRAPHDTSIQVSTAPKRLYTSQDASRY